MAPSSSTTATSIPLPTSLTSTTPTLPDHSSRLLVSHLRQTHALRDLNNLLTDSLGRTGWTDRVRALALELLRNGTADTFPELLEEVLRRARIPKDAAGPAPTSTPKTSVDKFKDRDKDKASSGGGGGNRQESPAANGSIAVREGWFGPDGLPDVRVPEKTVEVGVDFLRQKIVEVVEPVDDD